MGSLVSCMVKRKYNKDVRFPDVKIRSRSSVYNRSLSEDEEITTIPKNGNKYCEGDYSNLPELPPITDSGCCIEERNLYSSILPQDESTYICCNKENIDSTTYEADIHGIICSNDDTEGMDTQVSSDSESSSLEDIPDFDGYLPADLSENERRAASARIPIQPMTTEYALTHHPNIIPEVRTEIGNGYNITVDSFGKTFLFNQISFQGTIPQEAIANGETRCITIQKCDRSLYQSIAEGDQLTSDIFQCGPHGIKFNQQVLLQFPCDAVSMASDDGHKMKRMLIYSATDANEQPRWVEITEANDEMDVVFERNSVNIFTSTFCHFAVIQRPVRVMYGEIQVFGEAYPEQAAMWVRVILLNTKTTTKVRTQLLKTYGELLEIQSVCIVENVDKLTISFGVDKDAGWTADEGQRTVKTHYLWNAPYHVVPFCATWKKTVSRSIPAVFSALISCAHDDEEVQCKVFYKISKVPDISVAPEVEAVTASEDNSLSMDPKKAVEIELAETMPKRVLQDQVDRPPVEAKIQEEVKQNSAVRPMKLSEKTKIELAKVLDEPRADGSDWKGLAKALGYGEYCGQFYTGKTKHLMKLWELKSGHMGTKSYLTKALEKIGHPSLAERVEADKPL